MAERPPTDVEAISSSGFALADDRGPFASDWHAHSKHQMLYAASGTLQLEVRGAQWLLPPQRTAWIAATVPHRESARAPVQLRVVYLSPRLCQWPGDPCHMHLRHVPAGPGDDAARHALGPGPRPAGPHRLPLLRRPRRPRRRGGRTAQPFRLPTAQSPALQRAMQYALERLGEPLSMAEAARAAGLSERTLARRFATEGQSTWREFVHVARMLRAMEVLSVPGTQVTEAALAVGFESLGAFTRAFEEFVGERPRDYRRRVMKRGARS